MLKLNGHKAYIVAIIGALNVLAGAFLNNAFGDLHTQEAWGQLLDALLPYFGIGAIRHGVAKIK